MKHLNIVKCRNRRFDCKSTSIPGLALDYFFCFLINISQDAEHFHDSAAVSNVSLGHITLCKSIIYGIAGVVMLIGSMLFVNAIACYAS
jgi:hypothetical protein